MAYEWLLRATASEHERAFASLAVPAITRKLLLLRGVTSMDEAQSFLYPHYDRHVRDPYLFRQMYRVVERIERAIAGGEQIAIYGDYDADGVCSAAVLSTTIEALGGVVAEVYLPHREREGYGLHEMPIRQFAERGITLLVTLDCGTTNVSEIAFAGAQGIDVIVVDHHYAPETLPDAYAIINPKVPGETYPYKDLASVGLAFKLTQALLKKRITDYPREANRWESFEKWQLDLVAIATVTDLVPLDGENRALLTYGLVVLNKTRRPGLRALISLIAKKGETLTAESIGYQIGPRLNAAGRVGHAKDAYDLLVCRDHTQAVRLADALQEANIRRQRLTEEVAAAADSALEERRSDAVLVAVGEQWPVGLVGLVAGRLLERHQRPVLVISRTTEGYVGSGRSVPEFNIVAALHAVPELFVKFGGHAQACGFTLPDSTAVDHLRTELNKRAREELGDVTADTLTLTIDLSLELSAIDADLYEALELLQPYGMGNQRPRFMISGVTVVSLGIVGAGAEHLKLTVSDGHGAVRNAIGFRLANRAKQLVLGDQIDLAVELIANWWLGTRELQLRVLDIRPALKVSGRR